MYKRGNPYLVEAAQRSTRLPSGHPEAFLEAFANIYVNVAHAIEAKRTGAEIDEISMDFPTVQGRRGRRAFHSYGHRKRQKAGLGGCFV